MNRVLQMLAIYWDPTVFTTMLCVYLLYKYIKVGRRNSEWYKNYTWMLGMLLRMSDCVSSGVFGVLVYL